MSWLGAAEGAMDKVARSKVNVEVGIMTTNCWLMRE